MIAWLVLVLLFVVPACDLGLRLLGMPGGVAWGADLALAGFLIVPVLRSRLLRPDDARRTRFEPWLHAAVCAAMAAAWCVLRVSSFEFSPMGEGIYDLHYIASLSTAEVLPAPELWNPGTALTRYYYLGFYTVAFYARLLGLAPAGGYLLFLALIPVLVFAIAWSAMRGGVLIRSAAALAATFPATGLSAALGMRLIEVPGHLRPMAHVRLTEWADQARPGSWAEALMDGRAYPIEGLAHLLGWLGDLHPPVYTLLLLAVLIGLAYAERPGLARAGFPAAAGWAVPVSFFLNPWTMPCFATVALYAVIRRCSGSALAIVLAGAALGALMMWPLWHASDLATGSVSLAWLPSQMRSSPVQFLVIWGPLLLCSLVLILAGGRWGFAAIFAAMVFGLEWVLLDDPYGGAYERFNGVLKIGSFALAGWTMVVLAEAGRSRAVGVSAVIALVLACTSLVQVWDVLGARGAAKGVQRNGSLDAAATIPAEDRRMLFQALHGQCPGLTLERQTAQAYALNPLVSTLLAWPTLGGWMAHLSQIGAITPHDRAGIEAMQAWYAAPELQSLQLAGVGYVLVDASANWSLADLARAKAAVAPAYRFVALRDDGSGPVIGYFVAARPCR
ncbi:MAG: DUF2298 domain-containing protein [Nevskiales bacterium]|nr:DUF2298 domain-containing protein [Nevskiales bacterium]